MKPGTKKAIVIYLRIVISFGLITILIYFADLAMIGKLIQGFRVEWAIGVFGAILLSMAVSAMKWAALLKSQNSSVSTLSLLQTYLIGLFFNNFLPSSIGGDGVRILIAGKKVGRSIAASSIVVERLLATITLAFLGLVSALFASYHDTTSIILLSALLLFGLVLFFALLSGRIPRFFRTQNNKFHNAVNSFLTASYEYRSQGTALVKSITLTLFFQIIVALVVGAVIAGLGLKVPFITDLVFITCAASVLAMVPAGINGYGLREGAFVYLLKPLGFTVSSAIAISVLFAVAVSLFSLSGAVLWLINRSQVHDVTNLSSLVITRPSLNTIKKRKEHVIQS